MSNVIGCDEPRESSRQVKARRNQEGRGAAPRVHAWARDLRAYNFRFDVLQNNVMHLTLPRRRILVFVTLSHFAGASEQGAAIMLDEARGRTGNGCKMLRNAAKLRINLVKSKT